MDSYLPPRAYRADAFPEEKKAAKAERELVQATIVALLRHISKCTLRLGLARLL